MRKNSQGESLAVMKLPNQDNRALMVHGRACVPGVFHEINFNYAVKHIDKWISTGRVTGDTCVLVSAGPSLTDPNYMKHLKELALTRDTKGRVIIVCVKHALPILIKHGIVPDYCVVLDPRSMEGNSTHGEKRKSLYESARNHKDKITFLVASITDYKTTEYFLKEGFKVVGWNCVLQGNPHHHYLYPHVTFGSCAAIRAIHLFEILGFRQFLLFGYDSSYDFDSKPTKKMIKDKGLEFVKTTWDNNITKASPSFWTKGELAVQAQELCYILRTRTDLLFVIMCGGFMGRCWDFIKGAIWKKDYKEILAISE